MDTNVVVITFWQDLLFRQGGIFFILMFVFSWAFAALVYDKMGKLFNKQEKEWWYQPTIKFIGIFTFFLCLYGFHWINMNFL